MKPSALAIRKSRSVYTWRYWADLFGAGAILATEALLVVVFMIETCYLHSGI